MIIAHKIVEAEEDRHPDAAAEVLGDGGVLLHADPEVSREHPLQPVPVLGEDVAVEVIPRVDLLGIFDTDRAAEHRERGIARLVHADAHEHHHPERHQEEDDEKLQ
jgi:hypothetical protein